jgi:hypothetical protein
MVDFLDDTETNIEKIRSIFNQDKSGVGSKSTRGRTQQFIALGQSKASQTQSMMERSAEGVRSSMRRTEKLLRGDSPTGFDRDSWLVKSAAIVEAIKQDSEENAPKTDKPTGGVDFDESMVDQALAALAAVESRGEGGYKALGPIVKTGMYAGKRAYGNYQVMGPNIGPWTKEHYGQELTPQQFLENEEAQDAVAKGEILKHYKRYGNIEDAISMWFTGDPLSQAIERGATDQYTTIPKYMEKWKEEYNALLKSGDN